MEKMSDLLVADLDLSPTSLPSFMPISPLSLEENEMPMQERPTVTWTEQEDDILREQVKRHGTQKWALVAAKLGNKTSKQCRRRWQICLNMAGKKGGWTSEEDQMLLEGHVKYGNRWTEIAKMVPGRTDNAVKNRFCALSKKQAKEARRIALAQEGYSLEAAAALEMLEPKRKKRAKPPLLMLDKKGRPATRRGRLDGLSSPFAKLDRRTQMMACAQRRRGHKPLNLSIQIPQADSKSPSPRPWAVEGKGQKKTMDQIMLIKRSEMNLSPSDIQAVHEQRGRPPGKGNMFLGVPRGMRSFNVACLATGPSLSPHEAVDMAEVMGWLAATPTNTGENSGVTSSSLFPGFFAGDAGTPCGPRSGNSCNASTTATPYQLNRGRMAEPMSFVHNNWADGQRMNIDALPDAADRCPPRLPLDTNMTDFGIGGADWPDLLTGQEGRLTPRVCQQQLPPLSCVEKARFDTRLRPRRPTSAMGESDGGSVDLSLFASSHGSPLSLTPRNGLADGMPSPQFTDNEKLFLMSALERFPCGLTSPPFTRMHSPANHRTAFGRPPSRLRESSGGRMMSPVAALIDMSHDTPALSPLSSSHLTNRCSSPRFTLHRSM